MFRCLCINHEIVLFCPFWSLLSGTHSVCRDEVTRLTFQASVHMGADWSQELRSRAESSRCVCWYHALFTGSDWLCEDIKADVFLRQLGVSGSPCLALSSLLLSCLAFMMSAHTQTGGSSRLSWFWLPSPTKLSSLNKTICI